MSTPQRHFEHLLHARVLQRTIDSWLQEDMPSLDYAGCVVGRRQCTATLFMKSDSGCVLAGRPFFDAIMRHLQCEVQWADGLRDGMCVIPAAGGGGTACATVTGCAQDVLLAERLALNALARCSGIATLTNRLVDLTKSSGWSGRVCCTRKTTPGFRLAEKYAVIVGGGDPHRYSLDTMTMLKDNHVQLSGGNIHNAVASVRRLCGFSGKIEVEARNAAEAERAAAAGADVVMLDNFDAQAAIDTAAWLKSTRPSLTVEVSGGISERNVCDYAHECVDAISTSTLTQGYPCVDWSLKII